MDRYVLFIISRKKNLSNTNIHLVVSICHNLINRYFCNTNPIMECNMLDITNFSSLIYVAKKQPQPQKFLVAFIEVCLPKHHKTSQTKEYLAGTGGVLKPIQLVETEPEQLNDLNSFAKESLTDHRNWRIALIGCFSGENGTLPSSDITKKHKATMIQQIKSGIGLSQYIAFHRNGDLLQMY